MVSPELGRYPGRSIRGELGCRAERDQKVTTDPSPGLYCGCREGLYKSCSLMAHSSPPEALA